MTIESINKETQKRITNIKGLIEAEKASEKPDAERIRRLEIKIQRLQTIGF